MIRETVSLMATMALSYLAGRVHQLLIDRQHLKAAAGRERPRVPSEEDRRWKL